MPPSERAGLASWSVLSVHPTVGPPRSFISVRGRGLSNIAIASSGPRKISGDNEHCVKRPIFGEENV